MTNPILDIRTYRSTNGLTRAELATLLGVNSSSIYRWESGRTNPSQLALDRLMQLQAGGTPIPFASSESTPKLRALAAEGYTSDEINKILAADSEIHIEYCSGGKTISTTPTAWVRNGPPDQNKFHEKLIRMQFPVSSRIPIENLALRLSVVESVNGFGKTAQFELESPKSTAMAWNSNYGSHGWHRYVGRFPPHLVRSLINYFGATSESVVCDPFSGSGTTAVECRLLGIPFVGIEICPLSFLMTKTKSSFPTSNYDLTEVASRFEEFFTTEIERFQNKHKDYSHSHVLKREGNLIETFTNIEKWFTPSALLGVSIAVQFGMSLDGFQKDAFLLAISAKMRSIGNVDVDVVRAEYSKKPRENVDVVSLISRHLRKMTKDIEAMIKTHKQLITKESTIQLHESSVLDTELPDNSVDFVITSPPYGVEAISYLRTHLLSYRALKCEFDHDPYDTRDKTIGSEYAKKESVRLSSELCSISETFNRFFTELNVGKELEERKYAMMKFFEDLYDVGKKIEKSLKPGGGVAFVIGNKRLGDDIIPADKIISEIYNNLGLTPVEFIKHKLKTNNSNSSVPWQDRVIDEEYVLIMKKVGNLN